MSKKATIQPETADTVISRDLKIKGDIRSDNDIWIDGEVEGSITTQGNVSLGTTAKVFGPIEATEIIIAGKVHGDLRGSELVACESSSKVMGDIYAPHTRIDEGALFNGRIEMGTTETEDE